MVQFSEAEPGQRVGRIVGAGVAVADQPGVFRQLPGLDAAVAGGIPTECCQAVGDAVFCNGLAVSRYGLFVAAVVGHELTGCGAQPIVRQVSLVETGAGAAAVMFLPVGVVDGGGRVPGGGGGRQEILLLGMCRRSVVYAVGVGVLAEIPRVAGVGVADFVGQLRLRGGNADRVGSIDLLDVVGCGLVQRVGVDGAEGGEQRWSVVSRYWLSIILWRWMFNLIPWNSVRLKRATTGCRDQTIRHRSHRIRRRRHQ